MAKQLHKCANRYEMEGDNVHLFITRRNGDVHQATFDCDDFPQVSRHQWHVVTSSIARERYEFGNNSVSTHTLLGRFIDDTPEGHLVTYLDGNPLNCRRANIRRVNHRADIDQRRTSSGGAECVYKIGNRFHVRIRRDGKVGRTTSYPTLAEAIAARDRFLALQTTICRRSVA